MHTDTVSTVAQRVGITYYSLARRENSTLFVLETAQVTSFLVGAFATPQVRSVSSNGRRAECVHTTMRDHCRRYIYARERSGLGGGLLFGDWLRKSASTRRHGSNEEMV